jgi:hypothetical protein
MYAKLSDGGGVSATPVSLVAVFSVFGCGRLSPGSAGVVTGGRVAGLCAGVWGSSFAWMLRDDKEQVVK